MLSRLETENSELELKVRQLEDQAISYEQELREFREY
jgi:predicted RNase H-like nuclease (RuvC/YqgF family)